MTCEGKKPHELSQHDLRKALTFHQTRAKDASGLKGKQQKDHGGRASELKLAIASRKAPSYLVK